MYLARAASELGALPSLLGREGIGIVPDIYSPAELAALNAVMDPVFAAKTAEARAYIWPDDMLRLGILDKVLSPAMRAVLFSVMPDPVIYHLLSSEIAAGNNQPHFAAEEPGGWHRDKDCEYYPKDPTHISIFVYLSEVGKGDGAFEISPQPPEQPLAEDSPVVSMTGHAGTSFVWHRSFYHRASPNAGPRRRRIIKISIQRNQFPSVHLKNHFFRNTLAGTPAGDPEMDMLLGRFQGKTAPAVAPARTILPAPAKPSGTLGSLALKLTQKKSGTAITGQRPYTPRDASDLGQLSHLLAHDGVALLPDIFSANELAALNAAIDPFFKARPPAPKTYLWADDMVALNILDKILSPAMRRMLFSLLPDPVIYHLLVSEIAGGATPGPGGWHRDGDCKYFESDPTHLSVVVYLSNTGRQDGMFEVSPQPPGQPLRPGSPVISLAGSAGLSFVWNRGFHYREAPNAGPKPRRIIKISIQRNHFASTGLKQPYFRRTLAETPAGDPQLDMLFGRFETRSPPDLSPETSIMGQRIPVMSAIGQAK